MRVWTGEPALLARPASELLGRKVSDVIEGPMGARFHELFRNVYDTGNPQSLEYSLDVRAGRRTFSCEARAHESRSGGGRTVTLLVRDVTAAKELEGKLVQAERLAALGLLAASVGHEIRQPLAYLLASVDALQRASAASTESSSFASSLDNVRKGASRIAEIAATLDMFARQRRRSTTTFDVRLAVRAALDLCASELDGRANVDLQIDDALLVRGDEGELTQVFANLFLNAAHAIAKSTQAAPGRITIRATRTADRGRVSVVDTGTGISPEVRERIFDPFFTTKEAGRGTGLGLFISRNIVVAHGGTLEVESVPGSGTIVVVALLAAPSGPTRTTSDVRPRVVTRRRRLSLLIVDDERRFLDSLRLVLDGIHYIVAESDATKALALLSAEPVRFDVVLCDLSMPALDGPTFHAQMKNLGVEDRFVLMTGGAYTAHAAEFLEESACARIDKPFRLEELLALLEDVTRSRTAS